MEGFCDHYTPHSGKLPMTYKWRDFRWWLKMMGWHEGGYCDYYFPRHLLRSYAAYHKQQKAIWGYIAAIQSQS